MSERQRNRDAVDRVAARIKAHNDQKGGAMQSASEARQQAAEIARKADAQKDAGALRNPNQSRAKKQAAQQEPQRPRKSKGPRIFIDLGRKG